MCDQEGRIFKWREARGWEDEGRRNILSLVIDQLLGDPTESMNSSDEAALAKSEEDNSSSKIPECFEDRRSSMLVVKPLTRCL